MLLLAPNNRWLVAGIRLERIRGFKDFDLDLLRDGAPRAMTVLIGTNGTGKSTLLRAVCIGLAPPPVATSMLAARTGPLVTAGEASGRITIRLQTAETRESTEVVTEILVDGDHEAAKGHEPPPCLVCGYGVARTEEGAETPRSTITVADSTHTLFASNRALIGAELTLRRLRGDLPGPAYERVLTGIKRALGLKPTDRIAVGGRGGVTLSGPTVGTEVALEGWADGYRVSFLWMLDVFGWAHRTGNLDGAGNPSGIVLVDELEQHLHPRLQRDLLPRLRRAFPKVQWLGTTHSPLVTLAAEPDEIVSLKRGRTWVTREPVPAGLAHMSAEDVLTDESMFDAAPYARGAEQDLDRYRALAAKSRRSRSDTAEMGRLAAQFLGPHSGAVDEHPMIKKIDELIAEVRRKKS